MSQTVSCLDISPKRGFLFIPVSSYGAFDNPGLSNQLLVETGGYDFTVTTLSTFDIDTLEFERDSKQLSLFFNTAATDNVMEITIPGNLIGGNPFRKCSCKNIQ